MPESYGAKTAHKAVDGAKGRPAEVSGLAGAVTILLVHLLGVDDPELIVALGVIVGSLPALVTAAIVTIRDFRRAENP